jgi:hypothetical protein
MTQGILERVETIHNCQFTDEGTGDYKQIMYVVME